VLARHQRVRTVLTNVVGQTDAIDVLTAVGARTNARWQLLRRWWLSLLLFLSRIIRRDFDEFGDVEDGQHGAAVTRLHVTDERRHRIQGQHFADHRTGAHT